MVPLLYLLWLASIVAIGVVGLYLVNAASMVVDTKRRARERVAGLKIESLPD